MRPNPWLSTFFLAFIAIEILGILYWHSADEICPKCKGTGRVWVSGFPPYVPDRLVACSTCGGTGFVWRCSAIEAAAIYSLFFTLIFFGLFIFAYMLDSFYADMNPWVRDGEEMHWSFNPMFTPWLFRNDRRRWALYTTIMCSLLSLFIGAIIFYAMTYGRVTFRNALIGFSIGCGLLTFLALSWYRGFWKPRTREKRRYVPIEETENRTEEYCFPSKLA
jgi:hypothetical protein